MAVATVIPCRDEANTIGRLLDALTAQTRVPDEIIVVDDKSTDQTRRVLDAWRLQHPSVAFRVVDGPGRGVAAAMNAGITVATADVIVRLDGHSVPCSDYIERSLSALARPSAGIVGGVWTIRPGAQTTMARAIAAVVGHPAGSGGARYRHADQAPQMGTSVETVPFGTFKTETWRALGGFDESLMANEDYDFNYRLRQSGAEVILDGRIQSAYQARPTLSALARQYHRYGFWKARMLKKDPRAWHVRQIAAAAILPTLTLAALAAWVFPSAITETIALIYPTVVVIAAAHIALRAKSTPLWPAAVAALATVHLSWSAGFVRALIGASSPDSPRG